MGTNNVVNIVEDPIPTPTVGGDGAGTEPLSYWSGGLHWYDLTTGQRVQGATIYNQNTPGSLGKANGLGDVEAITSPAPIEIGNRVWTDTNKDGIQNAGESPLSGITVTLALASAPTTVIATATTDANGNYYFSSATGTNTASAIYGLALNFNANYILKFPITVSGNSLTTANLGGNDLVDSDADAAGKITFTTGAAGENNHTFDVGYITCIKPNAGTDQAPTCSGSTPITTVTLAATAISGGAWTQIGTTPNTATITTPSSATSTVTGLIPGVYQFIWATSATCSDTVKITIPTCSTCPTTTSPICAGESYLLTAQAGLTGYQWYTISGTDTTAIAGATNQTYTATAVGSYIWKATDGTPCPIKLCCPVVIVTGSCYGSLGDYVWFDVNKNGLQDGTEVGISGVKVYLKNPAGTKLDSTITDGTGFYHFINLVSGSYVVQVVKPTAYTGFTLLNVGTNDAVDSDVDATGTMVAVTIDTTQLPASILINNMTLDAGLYKCPTPNCGGVTIKKN